MRFFPILIVLLALGISTPSVAAQDPGEIHVAPTLFNLPESAIELVEQRTRDSKVFVISGKQRTVIIGNNLHTKSNAGKWVNPNPKFDATTDTDVKAKLKGKGLRLTGPEGEWVEFALPSAPIVSGVTAFYADTEGLTWVYIKSNRGVKLQALVGESRGTRTYSFPVTASSPLRVLPNGGVAGKGVIISPPEVIDNTGRPLVFSWTLKNGVLSFTFNDAGLALPYTIDPTTTFDIAAGGDDGHSEDSTIDPVYANVACDSALTTDTTQFVSRLFTGAGYSISNGHLRWDTSAIPDNATVTSASLRLYVVSKVDSADARSLVADWNDFGAALTCADWVHDALSDAHSGTTIASISTGQNNTFALSNLTNVNLTGFTGLRLHISGGQPTASNRVEIAYFDHATLDPPQLSVTYTVAEIVMIVPGISSGYHTLRVTHSTTGSSVYVDGVLRATAGVTIPSVANNANNWNMLTGTTMPYVDYTRITIGGTQRLWFQMNELPDHQIDDRSGNNNNATARYPDTPPGLVSTVLPLAPTGITFSDVITDSGEFVAPQSSLTNLGATEHLNTPTFPLFLLFQWGAQNSQGAIPYQAYLLMFAFITTIAAMLGSWYALRSVHITWIATVAASITFVFVGAGIWTWMIPFSFAVTGAVYIFWRRGAV